MDRLNASDLGGSYAPERADEDERAPAPAKPAPKHADAPPKFADKPAAPRHSVDAFKTGAHQAVKTSLSEMVGDDAVATHGYMHSYEERAADHAAAPKPAPKPTSPSAQPPPDRGLMRNRNSSQSRSQTLEFAETHKPVPMSVSQLLANEHELRPDDGSQDYQELQAQQAAALAAKNAPRGRPSLNGRRATDGDGTLSRSRNTTREELISIAGAEKHRPVNTSVSSLLADEYQSAFTLHDPEEPVEAPKKVTGRRPSDGGAAPKALGQRRNSRDLSQIVHDGGKPEGVAAGHFSLSSLVGDEAELVRQESGPHAAEGKAMTAVEKAKAEARAKQRKAQEDAAAEAASKKHYYTAGGVFTPHGATNASLHAHAAAH